jgi:hypothetical protein
MSDPTQVQRIAQQFAQHWARDRAQEPLSAIAQAKQGDPSLLQANALMAEAFTDAMGVALDVHDGVHQQLWAKAWQQVREGLATQPSVEAKGADRKMENLNSDGRFCVDGHEFPDSESNWMGDGQYPPFAVFDIVEQKNLLPYYLTRKQAEQAMDKLIESMKMSTTTKKPEWSAAHKLCANTEGWDIFDTGGKEYRLCRIDDPEQWMEDMNVPSVATLSDDEDAWKIVLSGMQPHHVAALEFMKYHNPDEVAHMRDGIATHPSERQPYESPGM